LQCSSLLNLASGQNADSAVPHLDGTCVFARSLSQNQPSGGFIMIAPATGMKPGERDTVESRERVPHFPDFFRAAGRRLSACHDSQSRPATER
jgi:hypothetical protein